MAATVTAGDAKPGRESTLAEAGAVGVLALALLLPALLNGYPLIFPDSAAYLRIAYLASFGVERASGYGFFLKPLVAPGFGPWLALVAQVLLVAAVVWWSARSLVGPRAAFIALLVTLLLSSWPWHAAQLMPDAFTGPLILLAWLAVSGPRGPAATIVLGVMSILMLTMHYTHLALFVTAALAALLAGRRTGEGWEKVALQALFPLVLIVTAALAQLGANAAILKRPAITPGGPVFLFARLHEDGLIKPWLDRHCGERRIARLCAVAPSFPRDSQLLLWGDDSPIVKTVWLQGPADLDRWPLVDEMAIANRGAILLSPLRFVGSSLRGMGDQLIHFRAMDDECPRLCKPAHTDINRTVAQLDPDGFAGFRGSLQATTGLPVAAVRLVTTPIAALAMLALMPVLWLAHRRGDRPLASLAATVLAALLANAAMAGALSDVHDRYQSRVAWLAVLVVAVAALRWRAQVTAERAENRASA